MKKLFLIAAATLLLAASPAFSQALPPGCSSPRPDAGTPQKPVIWTPGQWVLCLSSLQPALGYAPVNKAGDTMLGPLVTAASVSAAAGFNVPQGAAPSSPNNGDMWMTSSGLNFRYNGTTVGPISSSSAASVPTGTSGATIPLNNGGFTQSGIANFSNAVTILGTGSFSLAGSSSGSVGIAATSAAGSHILTMGAYNGDSTRLWMVGNYGIGNISNLGTSADLPTLQVQHDATYTGGTAGLQQLGTVMNLVDNWGAGVVNGGTSFYGTTTIAAPAQSANTAFTGFHYGVIVNAALGGAGGVRTIIGGNFAVADTLNGTSSVDGGFAVQEIDMIASKADDGNDRFGLHLVGVEQGNSTGATDFYAGLNIGLYQGAPPSGNEATIDNAIYIDPGATHGIIKNGIDIVAGYSGRSGTNGIEVGGTVSNAHIEIKGDTSGTFNIGGLNNTNGQTGALINLRAGNSSSIQTNYASIGEIIGSNTAGSETGILELFTRQSGTLTEEARLNGGLAIGTPTGLGKGVGSVNAKTGYWFNGTAGLTKACSAMPTGMTISGGIITSITGGTCA